MTTVMNMSDFRATLPSAMDQVADGDIVLVKRRGKPDAALIDSDMLEDFLSATNPRLIKKVATARADKNIYDFNEVFAEVL
jgi:prevent-host-death family protein